MDFLQAVQSRNRAEVQRLLKQDPKKYLSITTRRFRHSPVHLAVLNEDLSILSDLLNAGFSSNAKDVNGRTPLHSAAAKGLTTMVSELLRAGATNSRDNGGVTPLHEAAYHSHLEIAKAILDTNIDPLEKSNGHNSAYDYALTKGNEKIVELLRPYFQKQLTIESPKASSHIDPGEKNSFTQEARIKLT